MKFWKSKSKKFQESNLGKKIKGKIALSDSLSNKSSKWPSRRVRNRIEPLCEPVIEPQHSIGRSDQIFTIGSCFARNIEIALKKQNFIVPSSDVKFPQEELWSGTGLHSGLLNKYTPQAILNELDYVFNDAYKATDFLIEGDNGKFVDMQLHSNQGTSYERGIERRRQIKSMIKEFVTTADVIVVTLGLIEVWWDSINEVYLNEMPSKALIDKHKDRFYFQTMTPDQVFKSVSNIIKILNENTKEKTWIMLTVSPVPLARTFRNKDVIVANMYSKSLLRVAAELECEKSDSVEYFPSYESVMLSNRKNTWQDDLIHVESDAIQKITNRMIEHYCKS